MRSWLVLLLSCSPLLGQEAARVDIHGTVLPANAVARIGYLRPARHHTEAVVALAYSRDGRLLASASRDGMIRIWNPATSTLLHQLFINSPSCLTFAPDGKSLAALSEFGDLRVWELSSGKLLLQHQWEVRMAKSLSYSPDGKTMAVAHSRSHFRLFSAKDGKTIKDLLEYTDDGGGVVFAPDGRRLITAARAITLWDSSGKRLRSTGRDCPADVLALSADGKTIAAGRVGGTIVLLDAETLAERRQLDGPKGPPSHLAFSAEGDFLAVAGTDRSLRVYRPSAEKPLLLKDILGDGLAMALSPDGHTVAHSATDNNRIELRDTRTGKLLPFPGQRPDLVEKEAVTAVIGGPRHLYSAHADGRIVARNITTGKPTFNAGSGAARAPYLALSPEGKLLAWTAADDTVHMCDALTGKETHVLRKLDTPRTLSFSPDGRTLAVGSVQKAREEARVHIVDATSGKLRQQFQTLCVAEPSIAFSADGQTILVVSTDIRVEVWDLKQELRLAFQGRRGARRLMGFHPDGTRLGVLLPMFSEEKSEPDRTRIEVSDPSKDEVLGILPLNEARVEAAAFSPDGRFLLSGGHGTVRLWEVATCREVCSMDGHHGPVRSISFLPNGRHAVTSSEDGTALVWDLSGRSAGKLNDDMISPQEFDRLWVVLANRQAKEGQSAVWRLATAKGAVELLRGALMNDISREELKRLIAQLDDRRFPVRAEAQKQLVRLGEVAKKELEAVLEEKPSLEMRRRIEEVLDQLPLHWERRLREDRSLQILEIVGSVEARQLLEALESKATEKQLRHGATLALKRIKQNQ